MMELLLICVSTCVVHSVIRFLCVQGEMAAEIHRQISFVYGQQCMSKSMVCRWVHEFNNGRSEMHDIPRADRPFDADSENSITTVCFLLDEALTVAADQFSAS